MNHGPLGYMCVYLACASSDTIAPIDSKSSIFLNDDHSDHHLHQRASRSIDQALNRTSAKSQTHEQRPSAGCEEAMKVAEWMLNG